jgi:uncharacterized protein (TIGR04255 family)
MSPKSYKNPPIAEAVCEVRFQEPPGWDFTVTARYFELIKEQYPDKPKNFQEQQVEIQPNVLGYSVKNVVNKHQFSNEKRGETITLSASTLSVTDLPKYSGWKSFKPRIEGAISSLLKVAPKVEIHRIGIRYINRIEFTEESFDLSDFFTCIPPRAEELPTTISGFQGTVEFLYDEDPSSSCRVQFAKVASEKENTSLSVILDIDIGQNMKDTPFKLSVPKLAKLMDLIEGNRVRQRKIFEALITDECRKKFNGAK